MKTTVYTLPTYYGAALINDDYSGLEAGDIEDLDNFVMEHKQTGRCFNCIEVSEDSEFKHGHDMNRNQGADVSEFTFNTSKIKGLPKVKKRNRAINFMYFITNYQYDFIEQVWGGWIAPHLRNKFSGLCEKYGRSDFAFLKWYFELDDGNKRRLHRWVNQNYVSCKEYTINKPKTEKNENAS